MKSDFKFKFGGQKKLTSLLGLALDGSKLEGVVLKRTNGALAGLQKFSVTLALDPLTAAPELVGREIRNQLDAAGVRERNCIFGLPLKWVLTAQTELPPLAEADAASLLQLEAERGFHSDVATLQIGESRSRLTEGKQQVLFAGIPNTHLAALENILAAAKLKPVSFAPGITALQAVATQRPKAKGQSQGEPAAPTPDMGRGTTDFPGVLALAIGESSVGLQITAGGGVVALRSLEGAVEDVAGRRTLHADMVAREVRITLGQLPGGLRDAVKQIRIFGPRDLAHPLADELELRFEPAGLKVDFIPAYAPDEFGVTLPVEAALSPAFSLAARFLAGQKLAFDFLPPKPNIVELFVTKYSSGRLRTTGGVAVGVAAIFIAVFLFQQIQLWHYRTQWTRMAAKVGELQAIQDNIREYRSWYDGTFKNLAILRQLSLAFPEDGSVTAKNIEVRDGGAVTCSGTARDYAALLGMQAKLRAADGVNDVKLEQIRGKAPMQFVFGFNYNHGGGREN